MGCFTLGSAPAPLVVPRSVVSVLAARGWAEGRDYVVQVPLPPAKPGNDVQIFRQTALRCARPFHVSRDPAW